MVTSPITDTIYNSDQKEYIEAVNRGSFDLQWLKDERPTFGVHAKPKNERRGLTLQDINAAFAGEPEDAPTTRVMAPRGSIVDDDAPDMGYTYNEKYLVWADNVAPLY